jgi:hypothetical protein
VNSGDAGKMLRKENGKNLGITSSIEKPAA